MVLKCCVKKFTLPLYSDHQNLYDKKCFDFVISKEHKRDVKYETYIKLDEHITSYMDFDTYKSSCETKKKNSDVNMIGNVQVPFNCTLRNEYMAITGITMMH
ncbi:CYIR protein [Plasmodium cynomolgi strain B]|uniref:CYIR protein n=1 Tax=Plasmodium cynomolgi (strain B) TaxID=1120755 RepID=K6UNZ8_PLACD|nr:CYIR protein [Plasmodium cynomolgi strain B]GAB69953.1 CYIR protein [Plasmodium cynomolgi strain B]